jgi:hypothetical protein
VRDLRCMVLLQHALPMLLHRLRQLRLLRRERLLRLSCLMHALEVVVEQHLVLSLSHQRLCCRKLLLQHLCVMLLLRPEGRQCARRSGPG